MEIKEIFFNSADRLRSGWRFCVFTALFIPFFAVSGFMLISMLSALNLKASSEDTNLLFMVSGYALSCFLAIVIGWFCGKYLEGLPFRALGAWFTKYWFKDLVLGLLIGALSVCLAAVIAMLSGGLKLELNSNAGTVPVLLTMGVSLIVFVVGAANEEAIFRGYILQTFARANLAWLAILLTSAFFAILHLGNPETGYLPIFNTTLAGVWLAIAYLKTRTLWLVFGIHFAWNWIQGAFLGITVSGLKYLTPAPLLRSIDNGPQWLSGGEYGIEGSVACTIALIISAAAIWYAPFIKPTEEMLVLTDRENPTLN